MQLIFITVSHLKLQILSVFFFYFNLMEICELKDFIFFCHRKQDWSEAVHWYDSALNMMDYDEGGEFDGTQDEPRYLLLAREAEMYQEGGHNLAADPQRAGST